MELYIIRHAQSANNALENASTRTHDPILTDLGKQQADCLAAFFADARNRDPLFNPITGYTQAEEGNSFGITHLYCSPMYRSLQTTAPLARVLGLKPEVWIDIHEQGGMYLEKGGVVTGYPGRSRREILDEFPDYVLPNAVTDIGWYDLARGYESISEGAGRAIRVALELRRRAESDGKDARIAIITHGTFIDLLIKALFGQLPNRQFFYSHYNTSITRLDFDPRWVLIRYMNRVNHLPHALIS